VSKDCYEIRLPNGNIIDAGPYTKDEADKQAALKGITLQPGAEIVEFIPKETKKEEKSATEKEVADPFANEEW
jgi:hypothetical protein